MYCKDLQEDPCELSQMDLLQNNLGQKLGQGLEEAWLLKDENEGP